MTRESRRGILPRATAEFWQGTGKGTRRNPYDRDADEARAPQSAELRISSIDTVARLGSSLNVVDIGCATGRVTSDLLSLLNVEHVTGIDVSPKALALAQQKLEGHPRFSNESVTLLEGDFLSDPALLPPNTYDAAVALELFDIVSDPYEALSRIYGSLRPGGHLMGSWLSRENYYEHFKEKRGKAVAMGKIVALKAMPLIASTPFVNDFVGRRGYGRVNPIREADLPAVLTEQGFQINTIRPGEQHWFDVTKPLAA